MSISRNCLQRLLPLRVYRNLQQHSLHRMGQHHEHQLRLSLAITLSWYASQAAAASCRMHRMDVHHEHQLQLPSATTPAQRTFIRTFNCPSFDRMGESAASCKIHQMGEHHAHQLQQLPSPARLNVTRWGEFERSCRVGLRFPTAKILKA